MKKNILLALLGLTLSIHAGSPSFNCHKATTTVEMRICQSTYLSDLDREMFSVYKKVKSMLPAGDQKRWLGERNSCITSSHFDRCLADSYERRIDELHAEGQRKPMREVSYSNTNRVEYQCNTSDLDMLVAEYYDNGRSPKVSLNFDFKGRHVYETVRMKHAGSGGKYEGRGISFWEHHGEATLMFHGRKFVCKEIRD